MKLSVTSSQRHAKMRAHTATHLLHFALDKLLWSTKQAWSLVDNDLLRFDFEAKKPLDESDILLLESQINERIKHWADVHIKEWTIDEAKALWAKAFFEEKYWKIVRVVSIIRSWSDSLDLESVELCWWTHVNNISDIWAFKITAQSSVASWIRRIEAVTATSVTQIAQKNQLRLRNIAARLDCQPKQLENKLEKMLKEYEHLQSDHASLQGKIICTHLEEFHNTCELPSAWSARWNGCIINVTWTSLEHHSFKEVINTAKSRRSDRNWIIYSSEWSFAIYTGTGDFSAKQFAKEQWLRWWGSDQFVQGKDIKILEII